MCPRDRVLESEEFGMLMKLCNSVHHYFGSALHAPTATHKKYSKHRDNDTLLSFIKIIETHMGGNIISYLQLLRLRNPLVATIHSNEFNKLNVWREFFSLVQRYGLYENFFSVCQKIYPSMRVLSLASSNIVVMENIVFLCSHG